MNKVHRKLHTHKFVGNYIRIQSKENYIWINLWETNKVDLFLYNPGHTFKVMIKQFSNSRKFIINRSLIKSNNSINVKKKSSSKFMNV